MNASTSATKASSSKNRGAHLSATGTKDVALALGGLITEGVCDEGRIHLNPIIQQLSDALADFYGKDVDQIFYPNLNQTWISLQGKTNFFEKRVGEYQRSGVSRGDNTAIFTMDEEF